MIFANGNSDTIIFLDIDDTLASYRTTLATGCYSALDPVAVQFISHLATLAEAKVVLHSTRAPEYYHPAKIENQRLLAEAGFDIRYLHPDLCAHDFDRNGRWEDISAWLNRHPEVTKFIIIDDEGVRVNGVDHPQLIKINRHVKHQNGMLADHFVKAAEMLDVDTGDITRHAFYLNREEGMNYARQYRLLFDKMDEQLNESIDNYFHLVPQPSES